MCSSDLLLAASGGVGGGDDDDDEEDEEARVEAARVLATVSSAALAPHAAAVVRAVLLVAVEGLVFLSSRVLPKPPTRTGPKPPYVHPLGRLDVLYLLINSFIEFVFVNQILWLLWYSPLASSSSQPRALCLPRVQPDRSVSLARRCCVPARRSRCSMAPPRSGCCSSQTTCCTRRRTG